MAWGTRRAVVERQRVQEAGLLHRYSSQCYGGQMKALGSWASCPADAALWVLRGVLFGCLGEGNVVAKAAWGDARDRSELVSSCARDSQSICVRVPESDETRERTLRSRFTVVLIGADGKASWRRGHSEETALRRGLAVIRAWKVQAVGTSVCTMGLLIGGSERWALPVSRLYLEGPSVGGANKLRKQDLSSRLSSAETGSGFRDWPEFGCWEVVRASRVPSYLQSGVIVEGSWQQGGIVVADGTEGVVAGIDVRMVVLETPCLW